MTPAPFHLWEDWTAGLYDRQCPEPDAAVAAATDLLSDPQQLEQAMKQVLEEWPIAAGHHLTDPHHNPRAWLGQAACCLTLGVPAFATKLGWGRLTSDQRANANKVAEQIINTRKGTPREQTLFADGR